MADKTIKADKTDFITVMDKIIGHDSDIKEISEHEHLNLTETERKYGEIIINVQNILDNYSKTFWVRPICYNEDILFPIFLVLREDDQNDEISILNNLNDELVLCKQPYNNIIFHILQLENITDIVTSTDYKKAVNQYYGEPIYDLTEQD